MKNIAVVCGGNSGEYDVSMQSGKIACQNIDPAKYNTFLVEIKGLEWNYLADSGEKYAIDKSDFSLHLGEKHIRFDAVFNAIHGTPGEDGKLQGYFDLLNIPYTSCGVDSSALTFNKFFCNRFIQSFGIKTAHSRSYLRNEKIPVQEIIKDLGLPVFVKPSKSGSSVGISKVKKEEELLDAVNEAFKSDDRVLIEEFIAGREICCSVMKQKKELVVFPHIEVIPAKEFFDYEAKYQGISTEITPAELEESMETEIKALSSFLYRQLNCKGFVRFDYILTPKSLYFLEVNSIPGMTQASLLPQQARAFGMSEKALFTTVIDNLFES